MSKSKKNTNKTNKKAGHAPLEEDTVTIPVAGSVMGKEIRQEVLDENPNLAPHERGVADTVASDEASRDAPVVVALDEAETVADSLDVSSLDDTTLDPGDDGEEWMPVVTTKEPRIKPPAAQPLADVSDPKGSTGDSAPPPPGITNNLDSEPVAPMAAPLARYRDETLERVAEAIEDLAAETRLSNRIKLSHDLAGMPPEQVDTYLLRLKNLLPADVVDYFRN